MAQLQTQFDLETQRTGGADQYAAAAEPEIKGRQ
jgi:hypothetical protein